MPVKYRQFKALLHNAHLTKDLQGNVFWKGTQIEHFTYDDPADEKKALESLAFICAALENLGKPVTMSNIIKEIVYLEAHASDHTFKPVY